MSNMRSALGKARGLGSAKSGTGHWWHQRITALANMLLLGWLIVSLIAMTGVGYETLIAWLGNPLTATLMILSLISIFYHLRLGLQVAIEDYVHAEGAKVAAIIALNFFCAGLALLGIVSVIQIALGG